MAATQILARITTPNFSDQIAASALLNTLTRLVNNRPVTAAPDPLTLAGLMRDPDARALPAEQAFIETPSTDIDLVVVEAL